MYAKRAVVTAIVLISLSPLSCVLAQQAASATEPAADAAIEPYPDTVAVPAHEQAEPASNESRPQAQIEEIIVTSTKREESVRNIPVTINAVTGRDLEQIGAREVKDFIAQIPGITLQDSSSGEAGGRNITIRGVGPGSSGGSSGNSGNQTVGQFIGDVPMTDPYSNFITPDLDPYDLKSVEILKGPQGTTFGASALNGAIRYVPQGAELRKWSARSFSEYLTVEDGDAGFSYGGVVNVPIGETLAIRAVGVRQNAPGVYDNLRREMDDADSRHKWSGRGMLRWEPLDQLSVELLYQKQSAHQDAVLSADNGDGRLETNSQVGASSIDTGFDLASIDTRYRFEELGTLVFQGSYQHKDALLDLDAGSSGQAGIESLRAYANYKTKGHTYETRLVSPDGGDWNWIFGVFTMKYDADTFADAYVANTDLLGSLPILSGLITTPRGVSIAMTKVVPMATETSFYGEVSRHFGERWQLTLGARRYDTSFEGEREIRSLLTTNTAQIDQGDKGVSPKASLVFRPTADVMTYFTIARGFQFGGANAPPLVSLPGNNPVTGLPVPVEFDSSDIWSRELGIRTSWLQKTLQADLTLYDLDWNNAQFGQQSGGALSSSYIDNVGKVRSQGVEASLVYLPPIEDLSLNVAASYSRARTATAYDAGDGDVVVAGTEIPASPKVQTSTTIAYSPLLGSWATSISLNHIYWGPAFNNIDHEATIYDFQTYNLFLSIARPDWAGMPSITLGATNLTDERAIMSFSDTGAVSGGPAWIYNRPRALGIRLSAEFE